MSDSGLNPHTLFPTLLADIYDTYDSQYWTDVFTTEFLEILRTGTAIDMLAWLLAISPDDVVGYVEIAGTSTLDTAGLPAWMTRFKPSYEQYKSMIASITEIAPVTALLEPLELETPLPEIDDAPDLT